VRATAHVCDASQSDCCCRWDVTGWSSSDPNKTLADLHFRHCVLCEYESGSKECTRSSIWLFHRLCDDSRPLAQRQQEATDMGFQNSLDEYCSLDCDFTKLSTFDSGHLREHDIDPHCLHLGQEMCGVSTFVLDIPYQMHVSHGIVTRREVASPRVAVVTATMFHPPPDDVDIHPPMMTDDMEHHEHEAARLTTHLRSLMKYRADHLLPPPPSFCDMCIETGVGDTHCHRAVDSFAKQLCINGDESHLCSGAGMACFPYPTPSETSGLPWHEHRALNEVGQQALDHRIAAVGSAISRGENVDVAMDTPDPARQPHTLRDEHGNPILTSPCMLAAIDMCRLGVVMPHTSVTLNRETARDVHRDGVAHAFPGMRAPIRPDATHHVHAHPEGMVPSPHHLDHDEL
jgi:hypothetical protein